MNILLINHYAGSDIYGMEYRSFYMSREWVKLGHQVTILSASFSHLRNRNPEINKKITKEINAGVCYVWIKTPQYSGNGVSRVINIFTFVSKLYCIDESVIGFKPDVIITSSTYPFDIYPAIHFQKKYKCRIIYEVHDLWPLTLIELGGMSKYHPFIVLMQYTEDFAYKVSDKVVSLLPKAYEYMEDHGMRKDKFIFIPNGIIREEWETTNNSISQLHYETLSKIKEKDCFIVAYTGSHGLTDTLDTLIDVAILLKSKPVAFVLVGSGPQKKRLMNKIRQLDLKNVFFLPPVQKASIPNLLKLMDALYIGCEKRSIYRYGICPNKLFDYMMSAKPVIQAVEAGNDLVSESGCGITVSPENPEAISQAIMQLYALPSDEKHKMGLRGKEYVLANHEYKILAKRFIDDIS